MDYPFLAAVDDGFDNGELRRRIRKVLSSMELLSEARAMTIGLGTHGGDPDHLPPELQKKGALVIDGKPPRERSLFERYFWEFEQCLTRPDPQWAFRLLCACAERDYEHHLQGGGAQAVAGGVHHISEGQSRDGALVEKEHGDQLVHDYEGAPAGEVAQITQQPVGWVQKARELRGRDPETGLPKPGWKGWNKERRAIEVERRQEAGMTQHEISADLSISLSTVKRHWPREDRRRAA